MKTPEQYFIDWEGSAFGYGYGSGEPHIIPLLKTFFDACPESGAYDYRELEKVCGAAPAWFIINVLCRQNVLEYGTSPRGAWFTSSGVLLQKFIKSKTADELITIVTTWDSDYIHCYPDTCNCGPNGYVKGKVCDNPFWERRK